MVEVTHLFRIITLFMLDRINKSSKLHSVDALSRDNNYNDTIKQCFYDVQQYMKLIHLWMCITRR